MLVCRRITKEAVTVARGLPLALCRALLLALRGKDAARREGHAGAGAAALRLWLHCQKYATARCRCAGF